ncbi:MAG: hypothetical protein AB1505_23040 [Candidatus Latescibacterota bacterium]
MGTSIQEAGMRSAAAVRPVQVRAAVCDGGLTAGVVLRVLDPAALRCEVASPSGREGLKAQVVAWIGEAFAEAGVACGRDPRARQAGTGAQGAPGRTGLPFVWSAEDEAQIPQLLLILNALQLQDITAQRIEATNALLADLAQGLGSLMAGLGARPDSLGKIEVAQGTSDRHARYDRQRAAVSQEASGWRRPWPMAAPSAFATALQGSRSCGPER